MLSGRITATFDPAKVTEQELREAISAYRNYSSKQRFVATTFRSASSCRYHRYFLSPFPEFLTSGNLVELLENYSVMAIMAAGLLVVLISGGIDISFAAIAGVSQFLVATFLVKFGGNWFMAFALAGLFGAILGVVNAMLIYYLRAISVIVTISTMTFYFSILMFVTDGRSIYNLPDWFTSDLSLFSIPFPVMVAAIVLLVTLFLLSRLSIGRQIYGLGGNPEAAKRMGCNLVGCSASFTGIRGSWLPSPVSSKHTGSRRWCPMR